jgi:putative membrane protein
MITDWLAEAYPWTKAFHVMAVISWMAGLFYLPRLFVYHAERGTSAGEPRESLKIMEYKLLRFIMGPASIATWIAGLALVFTPGVVDWSLIWPWTKAAGVIAMTVFHHWLMVERKKLARGEGSSGRRYRLMNEVPTLLMVLIVLSVIVKF